MNNAQKYPDAWMNRHVVLAVLIGGGFVVGLIFLFAFTIAAAFPDARSRCNKALPDAKITSVESVGGKILCRTITPGADSERFVWLDGDGVLLESQTDQRMK